jgi:quinoprotein glucose dehydrogenase
MHGIIYGRGRNGSLIALDARNGKEVWIREGMQAMTTRGLNYWESKNKKDKRLVFTLNNTLQEIDAITGKSIKSFGDSGYVDMRLGLDRDPTSIRRMQAMTPGVIYNDLIIIGSAPGYIKVYKMLPAILNGHFTVPHPGEFGYDTWPKDAYKYVGCKCLGEMSVDQDRGHLFFYPWVST